MDIVKRIGGVASILLGVGILVVGFRGGAGHDATRGILDSPEASDRMLGTLIPAVVFGVIAVWLVLSKQPTK